MTDSTPTDGRCSKHRVLIVDDHPIVRQGLARLMEHEPDIEVCGGAQSVSEAIEQVEALRPDLVIVDISLKDSHGIELISQLKARDENAKLLVWSMFDEKVFAERALRAGAMGYVNKQESIETVVLALRQVLAGDVYLSRQMANYVARRIGRNNPLEQDPVERLSNRELEVFQMIGQGTTTRQIARRLSLSPKTIEAHRERIKAKLGLKNAAELSCRAVQWLLENL
jgi:DNA-binding NarL/FixJ family response regulator